MEKASQNMKIKAQELRRNMTREERLLWYEFLKGLPYPVKRQKVIGGYIADFYIPAAKIVIELDGNQHYSPDAMEYDRLRDAYMNNCGILVLRYSNAFLHQNFYDVCADILSHLNQRIK